MSTLWCLRTVQAKSLWLQIAMIATPMSCACPQADFRFSSGKALSVRHLAQAQRLSDDLGLNVSVLKEEHLAWDVAKTRDLLPKRLA